ncbi:MAG: hypothetical protein OXE93_04195 [bacterium]|nr:hypothetical protein [bacterium]MCY4258520.1 hypothetical protein [bacterium]MCY4271210.1 hypothetical protein [bacterium]
MNPTDAPNPEPRELDQEELDQVNAGATYTSAGGPSDFDSYVDAMHRWRG